jgi:hypothetical protein
VESLLLSFIINSDDSSEDWCSYWHVSYVVESLDVTQLIQGCSDCAIMAYLNKASILADACHIPKAQIAFL